MSFEVNPDRSYDHNRPGSQLEDELKLQKRINADLLTELEDLKLIAQLYHQAVDNSPNPIFSIDSQGIIQTWNPACISTFLYDEKMIGRHFRVLINNPEQLVYISEKITNMHGDQALTNVDLSYLCRDNRVCEMVSRIYPLRDSMGKSVGYVFANTDVTERNRSLRELDSYRHHLEELVHERTSELSQEINDRKKAQEALSSANEVLKTILDSIEVEISVTDLLSYELIFANKMLKTQLDQSAATGDSRGMTHRYGEGGLKDNKTGRQTEGTNTASGTAKVHYNSTLERWYLVHDQVIRWVDGRMVLLQVANDITERRRIDTEQQRVAKLESIGMLAGGIAHDFNNLLTGILGSMSLLRTQVETPENRRLLANIEKATCRAKDLTAQLLTFSKGGAPICKPTSIADLLHESVDFAVRGSSVVYTSNIAVDLDDAEVDAGQLTQVFHNLVFNAVQAMPDGGELTVAASNVNVDIASSSSLAAGRYIKILFKDNGPGISQENLTKIFDPYFTTKSNGSGLGLATAHTIIKKHNGHISAQSVNGATFTIFLPAIDRQHHSKQEKSNFLTNVGAKILVMDDEQIIREVAVAILRKIGCNVETVADGTQAVKIYCHALTEKKPFDAVILDLTIRGGVGGHETFEQLRKIDPQVKAIVSSGYSNDPIMAEYKSFGFCDVVTKPYRVEEMQAAIQRVITMHQ